jgi:hypothetical protein
MGKNKLLFRIGPILVLYLLSPLIAELLFASTPASRANQLILESAFYGSAVLLIREFVRRRSLGWFSIILLGVVFGILQECIFLQSVFNPHFLNLDLSFGRSHGVNWVWAVVIIAYHAIWSIAIPIYISEMIFYEQKSLPWLNGFGIVFLSFLFLLTGFAFFIFFRRMSGYVASIGHFAGSGILVLFLIILSFRRPMRSFIKYTIQFRYGLFFSLCSFLFSFTWFALLSEVFHQRLGMPPYMILLFCGLLLFAIIMIYYGWANHQWNDKHRFYLVLGAIVSSMLFGLIILLQGNSKSDSYFQIVFIIITTVLLVLLKQKKIDKIPLT